MGVLTVEKLRRVLLHNKVSKELRSKLLQEGNLRKARSLVLISDLIRKKYSGSRP